MNEYRCRKCNKLEFKGDFVGSIEIKCDRCGEISNFTSEEDIPQYLLNADYSADPRREASSG